MGQLRWQSINLSGEQLYYYWQRLRWQGRRLVELVVLERPRLMILPVLLLCALLTAYLLVTALYTAPVRGAVVSEEPVSALSTDIVDRLEYWLEERERVREQSLPTVRETWFAAPRSQ